MKLLGYDTKRYLYDRWYSMLYSDVILDTQ